MSGSVKTAVVYSYDPMGRTLNFWQCNPSNCGSASIYEAQYNYDLAGDVSSWAHPGLFTLTNTVNPAQQITAIQSSWQDSSHPQYLAQSISYTAWGAIAQLENGCVGTGCTNAQETYQYNKQLQPAVIELGTSSSPTANYCLVYNYYASSPTSCALPSAGTNDNGNVMGYWYQDSVNSSFSHTATYTYDGVNRLATAAATGNATYNLTFSYDAYGNMTCTTNGQTNGPCPNWAFSSSTNQLTTSGFTYDAAGDLTKDSSNLTAHTYQWDAEARVSSVDSGSTWGFTYDAVGDRAQWAYTGGASEHMFDPAGKWLGSYGSLDIVRLGGRLLVVQTGSETYFNHINNLGSTTSYTSHSGAAAEDMAFYPWGDVWLSWGSGGYNFASLPYRDPTTTTDLTTFRVASPNLGRWHSPDPLGGHVTNPQTWNRYAYVRNNPVSFRDPLGLFISVTAPSGDDDDDDDDDDGGGAGPGGGGTGGGGGAKNGTPQTPRQAATQYCQQNGQLSFNIPFTDIPVTISLSATLGPANYSATNDINTVFPVFPWPEWLAAGASVDFTINAPAQPTANPSVGLGKNLSLGYFTGQNGPQGISLSLGPSMGPPINVAVPTNNACGMANGGG